MNNTPTREELVSGVEKKILAERGLNESYLESPAGKEEAIIASRYGFNGRLMLDPRKSWNELIEQYGFDAFLAYFKYKPARKVH